MVEYQDTTIDISQGNIDLKSTHKQIVDIMEGGEEAFDKRQLIYTSWKLMIDGKNSIREQMVVGEIPLPTFIQEMGENKWMER